MNDAIQPSHPLSPPSPPALNLSHNILQKKQNKPFGLPNILEPESVHLITESWHPFTNLSLFLHPSATGNQCSKLLSVLRRVFLSWWLRFTRDAGDPGLIPGSGRSSGAGNSYPPQHSCLENPMDRGGGLRSVGSHRIRHH